MRYEDLTDSEKAKYDAYRDVYSFLHYEYKFGKKSKEQIVQDVKKLLSAERFADWGRKITHEKH